MEFGIHVYRTWAKQEPAPLRTGGPDSGGHTAPSLQCSTALLLAITLHLRTEQTEHWPTATDLLADFAGWTELEQGSWHIYITAEVNLTARTLTKSSPFLHISSGPEAYMTQYKAFDLLATKLSHKLNASERYGVVSRPDCTCKKSYMSMSYILFEVRSSAH